MDLGVSFSDPTRPAFVPAFSCTSRWSSESTPHTGQMLRRAARGVRVSSN